MTFGYIFWRLFENRLGMSFIDGIEDFRTGTEMYTATVLSSGVHFSTEG